MLATAVLLLACSGVKPADPADSGRPDDTAAPDESGAGSGADSDPGGDTGGVAPGRYFPDGAPWYADGSAAPVDPRSDAVIAWLDAAGWGNGRFQIDFSLEVLDTEDEVELRAFTPTSDFYSPDCDPAPVPVPPGGALEGEEGYACTGGGDCHLIVAYRPTGRLYEMWRADLRGDTFRGGCLAIWDMTRVYPDEGRGEQCTSADAAGYPIAPLLPTADEVAAGEIPHALRFILPNASIRAGEYVHPATHATGAASGPADAPPYGAHLRLRADYPLDSLPNEGARVVARALQRHGMFLADGGSVALTFRSDRSTTAKWADLLGPHDLADIRPADFELLETGPSIPLTYDCRRAPITE